MANVFTASEQQLTNLLNQANLPPKLFDNTRLTYGAAEAVTGESGYDTQVLATAIPGMGYYGTQLIYYTRINLAVLESQVNLYSLTGFTLDTIVSMLNAQFDTFLDVSDIVPMDIPTLSAGQAETITLVAQDGSIGWQGQVDITITYGKPQLNAVVGRKSLSALKWGTYPYADGVRMLWNVDFSSYRDALLPKQYGTAPYTYQGFSDYQTISDICTKLGIPWFNNAQWWVQQVTDHATSELSDANPAFDRVVVMATVLGGYFSNYQWSRKIYFHYNTFDKA